MTVVTFAGARRPNAIWRSTLRLPAWALLTLSVCSMILAQASGAPWLHLYGIVPLSMAVVTLFSGRADPPGTTYVLDGGGIHAVRPDGSRSVITLDRMSGPEIRGRSLWLCLDGGAAEPLLDALAEPEAALACLLDALTRQAPRAP